MPWATFLRPVWDLYCYGGEVGRPALSAPSGARPARAPHTFRETCH